MSDSERAGSYRNYPYCPKCGKGFPASDECPYCGVELVRPRDLHTESGP